MFGSLGDICGGISDFCNDASDACDSTLSNLDVTIGGTTYTDVFTVIGEALDTATKDVGVDLDNCW